MTWAWALLAVRATALLEHLEQDAVMRMRAHDAMAVGTTALFDVEVNFDLEALDPAKGATMYFDKRHHRMRLDIGLGPKEGLAWGTFADELPKNGWSQLRISGAGPAVSNSAKMYAAGYVEGLLSCIRISEYYHNTRQLLLMAERSHHSLLAIRTQLQSQVEYVKANVNLVEHIWTEEPSDLRWRHARFLLFQLWGMMDGYNYAAKHFKVHTLSLVDFFLLNSLGEAGTLMDAYRPQTISDRAKASSPPLVFLQKEARKLRHADAGTGEDWLTWLKTEDSHMVQHETTSADEEEWRRRVVGQGRCSALVRITEGYNDLLVGHTTWSDYSTMTRIWKYYTIPLQGSETMANTLVMSSYPGTITSGDNFFMADSGLVLTDTSLEMVNPFGFDAVKDFPFNPHLPNFMHVIVCLRRAKNAADFAKWYQVQNTGTLLAQWMVVDYNMFTSGKPVGQNLLWIIEQVPGKMEAKDMSLVLRQQGYWYGVNRPYFSTIRDLTWFTKAQQSHGKLYSVSDCPRCRIFRDSAPGVNNLFDMRGLINRNNYPVQSYGPFLPGHEISARFDLDPKEPIANGGIDSKITSKCMFKLLTAQAISGPTHAMLPFFKWVGADGREQFPGQPHVGLPNTWSFNWQQISPVGASGTIVDVDFC